MKFNILEIQTIITAIVILWFEALSIGTRLKRIIWKNPMDWMKYRKPFDCRFCTYHWLGTIISLSYYLPQGDFHSLIIQLSINITIALTYDRIFTIQD